MNVSDVVVACHTVARCFKTFVARHFEKSHIKNGERTSLIKFAKDWSVPGIEPGTTCTQSRYHASRPNGLVSLHNA
jgi:hypothetical protein